MVTGRLDQHRLHKNPVPFIADFSAWRKSPEAGELAMWPTAPDSADSA
jgi:hypothetical protein